MTQDNFEEFLRKTAQSYNAPPARIPREEMWEAIEAVRAAGPRVVYGGGSILRQTGEARFGSKVWWAAAAAAVVLVATGVGIGRWTASPDVPLTNTVAAPRQIPIYSEPTDPAPADARVRQRVPLAGGESRVAITPAPIEGSVRTPMRAPSPGSVASEVNPPTSAYQLAAANHLSDAEALLTSFRTRSAADQLLDAQLAAWARELLSNTRLLLDSPVAADPQRRPLLEDLELLLVQIVQLAPGSTPQDREIIERTLKQDQVLTRLRTAIPAGQRGS
jgi:hypothetical protein